MVLSWAETGERWTACTTNARSKVSDTEGLYRLVSTSGGKLWRLAYRFHGKQKSLALGKYPKTTLLEARRYRDEAKRLIAKGTDPSTAKKAKKRERRIAEGNTFEAVANEWFEANAERWVGSYSPDFSGA